MSISSAFHTAARKAATFVPVSLLALGLGLVPAGAQNQPPKPEDFKAMETPGAPARLTTPVTPSLLTPPGGPATPQPGFTGAKMVMTQAVWRDYVRYLQEDVAIGFGFFMITVDGSASDVKQCRNYACQISPVTQAAALDDCRARLNNRRCIIFAEGRDIKYAYQVVP